MPAINRSISATETNLLRRIMLSRGGGGGIRALHVIALQTCPPRESMMRLSKFVSVAETWRTGRPTRTTWAPPAINSLCKKAKGVNKVIVLYKCDQKAAQQKRG
jgi:hypothetical protein